MVSKCRRKLREARVENKALKRENTSLKGQVTKLKNQLAELTKPEENKEGE